MYLKLLLISIINVCISFYSYGQAQLTEQSHIDLKRLNKILIQIEGDMKKEKYKSVCKNSRLVSKIIETNIDNFKTIEKNYHWEEIKALADNIPNEFCKY